jgi:hypothetical protein
MKKISNIIKGADFLTYEKSIRDMLIGARNGLSHIRELDYTNDSNIRVQFELLLSNNDNDYLIRQLYLDYLRAYQVHIAGDGAMDAMVDLAVLSDISSRFPNETDKIYEQLYTNVSSSFNEDKRTLIDIIKDPYFNNLEEPIRCLILSSGYGLPLPVVWDYENTTNICNDFDYLLQITANDPLIRTLYRDYLIANATNKLNLASDTLKRYIESQDYATLRENITQYLLQRYPNENN